jgi:hypothetical protein
VEKNGRFFHTVETFFPLCGKTAEKFSIAWKNPVPEMSRDFPHGGGVCAKIVVK